MQEVETLKLVSVTPAAAQFMRRMVRFGGAGAEAGFRLTVRAGGCSGLSSEFTVEAAPRAGDSVVTLDGLLLFLPAESQELLAGVTIDFKDTRMESGLSFIDPKAPECGCSTGNTRIQLGALPS